MRSRQELLRSATTTGKRGWGVLGKTVVFGIFKRSGHVYTEIVPNCSKHTLQAVIRGRIAIESVIHSEGRRGYDGLVDVGYKKHYRVLHSADQFVDGTAHITTASSRSGALPSAAC